jgi:regulator of replication initiation timing
MNNSNIEFYVTYGKKALTSERANGTLALDGTDPENVQYRKDVFPGYTNFLREVFKARYTGEITEEEKITIFSQVKDFAIERIYAYRHKMGVVAQAEVVVEETISEVEALRAQVAELQAENAKVRTELSLSKATIGVLDRKLKSQAAAVAKALAGVFQ